MSDTGNKNVQKFKRINRLKIKITGSEKGPCGQIAPAAIQDADQKIAELCENSGEMIKKNLEILTKDWEVMRKTENAKERKELAGRIFMSAHEIKDIGSLCGYNLIAYFAESLRDYITETDLSHNAQSTIVQAHIDAMNTARKQGIKSDGSYAAEELKTLVKKAIDKYS